MSLPAFRYHPDPIATGAIEASDRPCQICGRARGFRYTVTIYCAAKAETVCPWCIADGSAARTLDGQFSDGDPLIEAGVAPAVVDEVTHRTPGYTSWQQEIWLAHCGDACAYLGDASKEDLLALSGDDLASLLDRELLRDNDWRHLLSTYVPGGDPAVHHFHCLHCRVSLFTLDFT
jgi:uncharacterized protein CbrC (UPF0167 family)